jgi:phenylalanyl-tRNA synthetase alpha chain
MSDLASLEQRALAELQTCADESALRAWNTHYLKGELDRAVKKVSALPPAERPVYGKQANELKKKLNEAYEAALAAEKERALARSLASDALDVTLPGRPAQRGWLHVSTRTLRSIFAIFADLGFQVYRSSEVEDDETNFGLLNMPEHHPARDMWDTFHTTTPGVLLRTHTSPGQIHVMRELCPQPIRVILPGMCYRYEAITTRSEIMFHQVEGLAIGERVTMGDLKGTLIAFARRMFGEQRKVRIRSSYFPFTEPSIEVDMDCIVCSGEGCSLCKRSGWLEILGAGMVHPVVLRNGGYDPERFSGFAFGMGPERIAMLTYAIDDIRQFWANDLRFLRQFGA